jgi:hypothetical protein
MFLKFPLPVLEVFFFELLPFSAGDTPIVDSVAPLVVPAVVVPAGSDSFLACIMPSSEVGE